MHKRQLLERSGSLAHGVRARPRTGDANPGPEMHINTGVQKEHEAALQKWQQPSLCERGPCCCSRMTAAHLQEVHRRRHLLVQPMLLSLMLVLLVHQHPMLLLQLVRPVLLPMVHLLVLEG